MNEPVIFGDTPPEHDLPPRSTWLSMSRGFRCRCPNCGKGRLFSKFARCVDQCDVCGEDLYHQRADDFPAYINIFVVGHITVAGFVIVERFTDWSAWAHLALWVPVTIIMAIALLQPIKGAVIGLQWAHYLHGFGGDHDEIEPLPDHD